MVANFLGLRRKGLALLLAILATGVVAVGASVVMVYVRKEANRERLLEFDFIVQSYRDAISLYQRRFHRFPPSLEALTGDNADQTKFIRRLYRDPIGDRPFGLRRNTAGEITDVFSENLARF